MTLRVLSASLAILVVLGFSGVVCAQEEKESGTDQTQANAKAKAVAETSKDDTTKSETKKDETTKGEVERATFGGGCFWCLEAVFERVPGVKTVVSGYAGGTVPQPSYEMVCTGLTGHAEVVQIVFDPSVVTYDKLLTIFWESHNPTTLNRQGPDEGTQYRSVIFYHSEAQKQAALKSYQKLTAARVYGSPIVTDLVPLTRFYPAERYHQDYFRKHPNEAYCQTWIVPKVRKLLVKLKAEGMTAAPKSEKPKSATAKAKTESPGSSQ